MSEPYTIEEAEKVLQMQGHLLGPYHREIVEFLVAEVRRLRAELDKRGAL